MGSFLRRLEGGASGVLDVAVTLGFALQAVATKLCLLKVWTRKFSWQAQGVVRLRVVVEVSVAVTLGVVCVSKCGLRGWDRETAWQGC